MQKTNLLSSEYVGMTIMYDGIPSAEMEHVDKQADQTKWEVIEKSNNKMIRSDTGISNIFGQQQIGRQVYVVYNSYILV
jgi:hypothetical protein